MCGFVFYSGKNLSKDKIERSLERINHRGPDDTELFQINNTWMGFKRLAIMDLTHAADQPFSRKGSWMVCNGEIYNYKKLKNIFSNYNYISESDCEVLLPIFQQEGIEGIVKRVDAEFACVIYDEKSDSTFAARDPLGIRPMFYGYTLQGEIVFASELKSLQGLAQDIKAFPPGFYYQDGQFVQYCDLSQTKKKISDSHHDIYKNIQTKLVAAVKKRMNADAKVGYLLSGGLDSSLVCSIAQKHSDKPIKTFAIGMSEDAIDLKYAKQVADYIGSDHTEVIITKDEVIKSLREVIYHLETWDITTIRASVGMYLVCKWIRNNTDVKVLMTGEVSDEIFGYKYTDFAPSAQEFQKEAQKRVREIYMYDVLRADRCISAHSLEARVPFGDIDFVKYVMSINPEKKLNTYEHGKFLLRKSFEGDFLPESLLYREKAAFSDAVGHSLVDCIKAYAEDIYTDKEFKEKCKRYKYATPFTKESLLFRDLFEEFYPKKASLIKDFWMPNIEWENCNVSDPSARVLPNYGASGV